MPRQPAIKISQDNYDRLMSQVTAITPLDEVVSRLLDLAGVPQPTRSKSHAVPSASDSGNESETIGYHNLPPSHTKPNHMKIGDFSTTVRNWKDVLIESAEYLARSGRLPEQLKAPDSKRILISRDRRGMTHFKKLSTGVYLETNWSSQDAVRRACQLIAATGGQLDDLQVWFR